MGEQLDQEPNERCQGVSEPNAASYVSSWREDMGEKVKDMLLTLTVGLERMRRNSERKKGKMKEGEGGRYYSPGRKGGRRRKRIMYSRKRKRGSGVWQAKDPLPQQ
jgi:hypothetical protein